ncbi:toprim domain-containing protein [Rhizobium tumorigenes]|uniref:toprim domain-containing protein n=1 Tax=Rhizobium tumorigenes TaxID=2041385 RepID=UPI002420267F|nr:toprim domain-containing protein [Rhizobium tumorigenes]WFS02195.1 toprim domain-containing protein [Rhizobium tumorigenes]
MSPRDETADIKQGLKDRIVDLCSRLLPDGRPVGRLWIAHNPITGDFSQSPEFKVALTLDVGAWKDWRTGEKGDVILLIRYLRQCDFREAMDYARDFLGIRQMSRQDFARFQASATEARKKAEDSAEAKRLKNMQYAEKLFHTGMLDGAGSTAEAHARAYFAARSIPLEQIQNRDRATMRYAPAAEFWPRAQGRHDGTRYVKTANGPNYPAIMSAMCLPTGQIAAVHCTFLSPLGPKKLPVGEGENAKLMRGEAKGAMIRISHGPEGEPPETAMEPHLLILGEGIETVASVAIPCPQARAWAAGSLSNMANAPIWLPCVSGVIVLKDRFKHKTTEKQFDKVMEQLAQHGKPLTEIESHVGNDFNDLAQEGDE